MIQPEIQKEKRSALDRLPRLGRVSQLVLIIGIFLILFVPLFFVNGQQATKQVELKATLANLQKVLAAEATPKSKLEAELAQVKAETEAAKAIYPRPNRAPEIMDSLMELAKLDDIYITSTKVSTARPAKAIGPILTIELGLKGQAPKFQNFMLALNDKLPTSQIKKVTFNIAGKEEEYDTASLTIDIQCYEGSE